MFSKFAGQSNLFSDSLAEAMSQKINKEAATAYNPFEEEYVEPEAAPSSIDALDTRHFNEYPGHELWGRDLDKEDLDSMQTVEISEMQAELLKKLDALEKRLEQEGDRLSQDNWLDLIYQVSNISQKLDKLDPAMQESIDEGDDLFKLLERSSSLNKSADSNYMGMNALVPHEESSFGEPEKQFDYGLEKPELMQVYSLEKMREKLGVQMQGFLSELNDYLKALVKEAHNPDAIADADLNVWEVSRDAYPHLEQLLRALKGYLLAGEPASEKEVPKLASIPLSLAKSKKK